MRASITRHVVDGLGLALTVAVAWFLWPSFLGGSSQMITVQGHSMEPTYHTGDLVVLDTNATPEVGKIIVLKIPADEGGGGHLVVHRMIGRRADGTYITQGDNKQNPDEFLTTRADILGSPRFLIPHGGQAIGFLSTPMGLALATGLMSAVAMWPRKQPVDFVGFVSLKIDDEGWSSIPISVNAMAEAEAWLRSQMSDH